MTIDLSPTEKAAQDARINAWLPEYQFELEILERDPASTLEQFIDSAWEKGILNHVSPTNQELRDLRAHRKRTLWQSRTKPVLYWRIQYAMEHLRSSIEHTTLMGPHALMLFELIKAISKDSERLRAFFPKFKHHQRWPWMERVCALLIERAQKALRDLGRTPHDPTLRRGATGFFRSIHCQIDWIYGDGTLLLKAVDPGPQNVNAIKILELHERLRTNGHGICPSLIDDPAAFTLPKGKR